MERKLKSYIKQGVDSFFSKYFHIAFAKDIRESETFIKKYLEKDLVGVEIGVCKGINAKRMLTQISLKKLYLIDPYTSCDDYSNYTMDFVGKAESKAMKVINNPKFKDKITFIRKRSQDVADEIPDNLDFVYIDGNHDYEFVKKDIELYYPKVKVGGVFACHDRGSWQDVDKAFIEFLRTVKPTIFKVGYNDWVIIKNDK